MNSIIDELCLTQTQDCLNKAGLDVALEKDIILICSEHNINEEVLIDQLKKIQESNLNVKTVCLDSMGCIQSLKSDEADIIFEEQDEQPELFIEKEVPWYARKAKHGRK
jgi:hypothetical protein